MSCGQLIMTAVQGQFVRPEADTLENLRRAFFDDLAAPVEEGPELPEAGTQGRLEGMEEEGEGEEGDEGDAD